MRTITASLSAIAMLIAASPLQAADVYSGGGLKDGPIPVAVGPLWTGFYFGLGAEGAYVDHKIDVTPGLFSLDGLAGTGVGLNVLGGYRYQWPGSSFVIGIEAEGTFFGETTTSATFGGYGLSYDLVDRWDVAGVIGFTPSPQTLVALKGGWMQETFHPGGLLATSMLLSDQTFDGAMIGGFIETKLFGSPNWSGRLEYDHFFSNTGTLFSFDENRVNITDTPDANIVKVNIIYQTGGSFGPLK